MVQGRNKVDESWSGIDVQLKRRHDLVPNLVETVKGYATHEREVFQAVTDARTRAMSASSPAAAGAAEGMLGQAIGRLFAVAEAYPDLKASTRTSSSCRARSTSSSPRSPPRAASTTRTSRRYNTRIQSFPGVLLAGPFGFSRREFFVIENAADRENGRVSFSTPPSRRRHAGPAGRARGARDACDPARHAAGGARRPSRSAG